MHRSCHQQEITRTEHTGISYKYEQNTLVYHTSMNFSTIAGRLDPIDTQDINSKTQILNDDKVDLHHSTYIHYLFQGQNIKKRFASLRFCVSSLHRDHANLLCIVKRLFNARAEARATILSAKKIYNVCALEIICIYVDMSLTYGNVKYIKYFQCNSRQPGYPFST
jgi:hypothetical protein